MLRSKFSSSLLALIMAGSLTACSIPAAQEREGTTTDAGTFFIEKSDILMTEQNQHEEISLAVSKSFNFKICLKDNSLSEAIVNHHFQVTGSETTQELTSNALGCINWLEKISYNHLAPAKWIEIVRSIKASGLHQGQRQATFAVNPWEDQGVSLLDKKIAQLIKADLGPSTLNAATDKGLWLDDVRLTVSEKVPGSVLGIEMRAQAAFSLTKSDGKNAIEPISRGNFLVDFTLINTVMKDKTEIRNVLGKTESVSAKVVGGSLVLPQDVQMNLKSLCSYGQILMAIRLTPQTKDLKLAPFEGVFTNLGECDQLKGNFFARLKAHLSNQTEGPKSISEFIGSTSGNSLSVNSVTGTNPSGAPGDTQLQASPSRVIVKDPLTFSNIGFSGPNAFQREKTFSVTACFQAPIDSKALRGQNFVIQKVNGQTQNITSLHSGCVTWDDSIAFQYLDKECWIKKSFQIRNDLLKMNETLSIDINPWDDSSASIRDSRIKDKKTLECAESTASKIVLNYYDFDVRDIQYPIDQTLGIKVQKQGILRLTARLIRSSPKSTVGVEETLIPPGKYLLRWAIVDNLVKDFNKASGFIYQAEEKEVWIEAGGTVADSLSFETANLRSLGNLNHILFEIEPLQASTHISRETYRGSIVLADRKEPGNLEPMGERTESLIKKLMVQFQEDQLRHKQFQAQASSKESLAKNGNLILANLNQEASTSALRRPVDRPSTGAMAPARFRRIPQFSTEDLRAWLNSGKTTPELTDHLCYFWFHDLLKAEPTEAFRSFERCSYMMRKTANSFLNIEYRYLVRQISKIEDLPVEIEDKLVGHTFAMSFAKDYTETRSVDINAGFNSGKLLSPFSFGGGGRYQWAWSTKEGSVNAATIQSASSLLMEKLKFKLRAEAYEKCALVQMNPESMPPWMQYKIRTAKNKQEIENQMSRGYLLCHGEIQNRPILFQESYTILNQKIYGAQASNPNSNNGRPLFVVVRGEKDHQNLMKMLAGKIDLPDSADSQYQSRQSTQKKMLPAFSNSTTLTYPGQYISHQ